MVADEWNIQTNTMLDTVSTAVGDDTAAKLAVNNDGQQQKQCEWQAPGAQGLYDPQNEHEACGVGFIVAIDGKPSHKVCYLIILHGVCVCLYESVCDLAIFLFYNIF